MKFFSSLSEWLIPCLIFFVILWGICGKKQVYEDFRRGAEEGLRMVVKIMPTMIAMLTAVNVLRASGILEFLSGILEPLTSRLHFPAPLLPLAIVKVFSSSGATGLLLDLYKEYGTDSYVGRAGSLMLSCTETIFYTVSLYFMSVGIQKTRYTLVGCLIAVLSGILASVFLAGMMG